RSAMEELHALLEELEGGATRKMPADDALSSLDPSFRAQEMSFVVTQIARNVDLAAAAGRRSWVEKELWRQPPGIAGSISAAQDRAFAHVAGQSLWLRNSVRGAVGLGLA